MIDKNNVEALNEQVVNVELGEEAPDDGRLTLETLLLMVTTDKVLSLEKETKEELAELRQRQKSVTFLHKLLRAINTAADAKGNLDLNKHEELKEILKEAREMGIELDPEKTSYCKEERERLIENIRIACDDLNMQNDMQIQTITRLTNERYEAFQLARSILKPLHEDKINKARALAGR